MLLLEFYFNSIFCSLLCVTSICLNNQYLKGPYVAGNRHGMGELVKEDGEIRTENYKEGKLVNFNITKEKDA